MGATENKGLRFVREGVRFVSMLRNVSPATLNDFQKKAFFGEVMRYVFNGIPILCFCFAVMVGVGCQVLELFQPWIIDPMSTNAVAGLTSGVDSSSLQKSPSSWHLDGALAAPDATFFSSSASLDQFRQLLAGGTSSGSVVMLRSLDHSGTSSWLHDFASSRDGFSIRPQHGGGNSVRELVVIDQGVRGWQSLAHDLRAQQRAGRALDVMLLDVSQDGVQQISQALSGYQGLSSVHIISHGVADGVQLGKEWLRSGNLSAHSGALLGWRDALAPGADILFYGCNLAADAGGQALVDGISMLTGADVAASKDLTGNAGKGGDWSFEYAAGNIDSSAVFTAKTQNKWRWVLDGTINIDQAWLTARGPGPYYLDDDNSTYVLQTDVSTKGTAFAIIAPNIVFDLNGHTVTYDNATPITVFNGSFEQGTGAAATGWDFTNAPNASRHQGDWLQNEKYDGDYSLKLAVPSSNQTVTSTNTVTLEANTTYSLSAMFEYGGAGTMNNPGVKGFVRLTGNGLTTREVFWNTTNYRGIQFREAAFSTGASAETYTVSTGIEGGTSAPSTNFFIDDIKIQRTRTYGVTMSAYNWSLNDYPGLNRYGAGTNSWIKNGSIIQGSDNATWGHGLFVHSLNNAKITDLAITVQGANSSPLFGKDQASFSSNISNNTLTSNTLTISSRDSFNGAVIYGFQGLIANNTIVNGPHSGIVTKDAISSDIVGNTIRLKSRYTNGFAIVSHGGSDIHENLIDNGSEMFSSRGILSQGNSSRNTRIFANTVRVQQFANNQEYEGAPIGGAYGIQLENSKNVEVFQNDVTAIANEVQAYAFRANSDEGTSSNLSVHHNIFRSSVVGTKHGAAIKLAQIEAGTINFADNTIVTNDGIIGETEGAFVDFKRTTIQVIAPVANPFIFEGEWSPAIQLYAELPFLDTTYFDSFSKAYFESAICRVGHRYNGAGPAENRMAFSSQWTTTFQVQDAVSQAVSDADVVVTDVANNVVFSGKTDQDGRFVGVAKQFRTQGSTKTNFNGHKVTVTHNGVTSQQDFVADSAKTVTITLPHHLEYQGSELQVFANNQDNVFTWSAGDPLKFTIDGQEYQIRPGTTDIHFNGLAGMDTVSLVGSSGNDELDVYVGYLNLQTAGGMHVTGDSFETVDVDAGTGGYDEAYFRDTVGDDLFEASPGFAKLTGIGLSHQARGFELAQAFSTSGNDTARLYDSASDDSLVAYHDDVTLGGVGYSSRATDFAKTESFASGGGFDVAYMYDSVGADSVNGGADWTRVSGESFDNQTSNFESVAVYGTVNGAADSLQIDGSLALLVVINPGAAYLQYGSRLFNATGFQNQVIDGSASSTAVVRLYGGAGNDLLESRQAYSQMSGVDYSSRVTAFKKVTGYAGTGGTDQASLYDSSGDDLFRAYPTWAAVSGTGYWYRAFGFQQVSAIGSTSAVRDVARFYDSAGQEFFTGQGSSAGMSGSGFDNRSQQFLRAFAYSSGGADEARLYDTTGNDSVAGDMDNVQMFATGYSNSALGFKRLWATSSAGGSDVLSLADSLGNDTVLLQKQAASFIGSGIEISASGFRSKLVRSIRGGTDSVELSATGNSNYVNMYETFSSMSDSLSSYFHRADNFASVSATISGTGTTNMVTMFAASVLQSMEFLGSTGTNVHGSRLRRFNGFSVATVYYHDGDDRNQGNLNYFLSLRRE